MQGTPHDVQILGQFLLASIHQQANSVATKIKTNMIYAAKAGKMLNSCKVIQQMKVDILTFKMQLKKT